MHCLYSRGFSRFMNFLIFRWIPKFEFDFFLENVPNLERVTFSKRRRSAYSKHKESIFSFVPKKVYKFNKCRIQFKIEHIQYKTYIIYRLWISGYKHKFLGKILLSRSGKRSCFFKCIYSILVRIPLVGRFGRKFVITKVLWFWYKEPGNIS